MSAEYIMGQRCARGHQGLRFKDHACVQCKQAQKGTVPEVRPGRKWGEDETERAIMMRLVGATFPTIGAVLGRTPEGVECYLNWVIGIGHTEEKPIVDKGLWPDWARFDAPGMNITERGGGRVSGVLRGEVYGASSLV